MVDADTAAVRAILGDAFGRVGGLVAQVTDGLSREHAVFRPDPTANTIAWLVWHLSRVQDDHVAALAGVEQAYRAGAWLERLSLPFAEDATGYGQSADDVARVRADPSDLAAYHVEVDRLTSSYLESLDAGDLDRVVDESWDPPVTVGVRLVSVLGDCLQHVGQAAYLRGLAERAG